jgi:hypothetical protein
MISMRAKILWAAVLLVCAVGGFLYVGEKYFNGFRNPSCVSDCGENGKRVR